ncbi:MAG: HisA/HisF-related TIM barrel protein [Candidatus Pacebacteria bacterium]|nr:HisA/HisF-related TIM barrel protein [Candidatus Paceibacterota bacterium]
MNKIEIIPAILVDDFEELQDKIELIKLNTKRIQIDICDGQFTPSATWPYRKPDNNFEMLIREDQSLPGWEKIDYEFDLMLNKPEEVVDDWVSVGATRIVLHAESKGDIKAAIEKLQGRVEIGLALNIDTPISMINDAITNNQIQFVQLMGIDHIGFQGQDFDAKVLEKIQEVKKLYPDIPVSIDGGVSLETAQDLIDAGADRLVIGSAILNAESPLNALEEFQSL